MNIINAALKQGRNTLDERESKEVLRSYGVPVTREVEITDASSLPEAVSDIGFPLVLKACSPNLIHKSENGLVVIDLRSEAEAQQAFATIQNKMVGDEYSILVQEFVRGQRELVMGFIRDPQFGPCVMFGLGGIFTETMKDVSFRTVPLTKHDCLDMMHEIRAHRLLGAIRGLPPVDVEALIDILLSLGKLGMENDSIREIDINPLIVEGSRVVAVDALIAVNEVKVEMNRENIPDL